MSSSVNQENQPGVRLLRRPLDGRILGGVAAGLASRYAINVANIRIALVVLSFFGGAGIPLYLAAWVLIPAEGSGVALADEVLSHIGSHLSR
jgi:phage shock protein PspC (stress-responsive transcriptional regulator)